MTKAPSPDVLDRERRVVELRRSGATFEEIAESVGYANHAGALHAYHRAMKRVLVNAGTEELRQLELSRLDKLQETLWPRAMEGDVPAVMAILKILDRRAKYLALDAPKRIEKQVDMVNSSTIDIEVARLVELLRENSSKSSSIRDR